MFTSRFLVPKDTVYMCGHSLGPMLKAVEENVQEALHDFGAYGIASWNKSHWIDLPSTLGEKIAELLSVQGHEVIVSDSTVVNLYKVLKAAIGLQKGRSILLTTEGNFPADLYIAQGIDGVSIKVVKEEELLEAIDENVALVLLSHVDYRTGAVLDIQKSIEHAERFGVLTVLDVSHSIGIVPLDFEECKVDFAVGATYKYLSGGPGSPAFLYAREKHHDKMKSPIQGWMGHTIPFAFTREYSAFGARKFMGGTPGILSMKGLEASLELFSAELIVQLYEKAMEYSRRVIEALSQLGIDVYKPDARGGHVAFTHDFGYGFSRALIERGVISDYREPNLIRLCINPLYLSMADIELAIEHIKAILESSLYRKYFKKMKVT